MTTPASGSGRPVRTAGLVLIGVAVVAVGLGIFALTSNGSGQPAAAGSTSTQQTTTKAAPPGTSPGQHTSTAPSATSQPNSSSSTTATTSYPPGQTTTIVPPPSASTGSPGGGSGGGQPGLSQVAVRVYNNGTIKNLAANAANDFKVAGFDVVEYGNYATGRIDTSTAYYSPAPGEQAVATALAQQFGMRVAPRFPGIAFASPGVIVIVTDDFKGVK